MLGFVESLEGAMRSSTFEVRRVKPEKQKSLVSLNPKLEWVGQAS